MERRNRSLKALSRLVYIDTLEPDARATELTNWVKEYLVGSSVKEFDLELKELNKLSELFYKNIAFLKKHRAHIKEQLDTFDKIKAFLS